MRGLFISNLTVLIILLLSAQPAEAAVVSGETCYEGGISYYLTLYYNDGGTTEELFDVPAKYTDEDIEILCRITEAEATGGTVEQKMNVASCVLNRVASEAWPDTIRDVVHQKAQFSPISDGRYNLVSITESTREAVNNVLIFGLMHDCDAFCTATCSSARSGWHSKLEFVFFDGEHNFYRSGGK